MLCLGFGVFWVFFDVFWCFLVFLILFLDSSRFSASIASIFVEKYCFWTISGPFYLFFIIFDFVFEFWGAPIFFP